MTPLELVRDLGEYLRPGADGPETEAEALAALAIVREVCEKALGGEKMDAYYQTPEGLYLCPEHADKDVQSNGMGETVIEYNAAEGCDPDGFPFDGSDTPDDVYRWTDGETCEQCK